MNKFWSSYVENVGGSLTKEAMEEAMKAMREQQDAYYRDPPFVIVPLSSRRK